MSHRLTDADSRRAPTELLEAFLWAGIRKEGHTLTISQIAEEAQLEYRTAERFAKLLHVLIRVCQNYHINIRVKPKSKNEEADVIDYVQFTSIQPPLMGRIIHQNANE